MPGKRGFHFLLFFLLPAASIAQTSFYDPFVLQKIEISFSQPSWDYQMDTAKYGMEGYLMADWVKLNGKQYDSVGVKYKGNSSYDSTYKKNPLHIELDTYKQQEYKNAKDIKLSNCYQDPSMIREVLAYSILGNYMDCPRSGFAQVYINGKYIGLYSNSESIGNTFLEDHFYSSDKTFIKCNPTVNPGPTNKCNLRYINTDSSQYFKYYEVKSLYGWNNLVKLCDTVTNYPSRLSSNIDLDRALWMLAFNNVLVNLDSYSGAFCQNYYLYYDGTGRYNPIVWDLNMAFGGFPWVGAGFSSMGTLTIQNMQQLPTNIHSTDTYWPLIKNIMADTMYKKMYLAHVRTIANEFFVDSSYKALAQQLQAVVDTAVQSDANKFFTYSQFQNGLTVNVPSGSITIPGIENLMKPRVTYLQSEPDFMKVAPVINNVMPADTFPLLGSAVTITADVSNADPDGVYLGFRFSKKNKFLFIEMYDDGAHGDGAAGDGVYGAFIVMNGTEAQYYVYAENNNAGVFSPQRAEHEFYTLNADSDLSTDLKIYPNPAGSYIVLDINDRMEENSIEIIDILGKKVYSSTTMNRLEYVNVSGLASGLYFVRVNNYDAQKLQVIHY